MTNTTILALPLPEEDGGGREDREMRGGGRAASVVTVLLGHELS